MTSGKQTPKPGGRSTAPAKKPRINPPAAADIEQRTGTRRRPVFPVDPSTRGRALNFPVGSADEARHRSTGLRLRSQRRAQKTPRHVEVDRREYERHRGTTQAPWDPHPWGIYRYGP